MNEVVGGSEKRMRVFDFSSAMSAKSQHPTILFFDEIDSILEMMSREKYNKYFADVHGRCKRM